MKNTDNPFGLLAFLPFNHDWNKHSFPPQIISQAIKQIKDLGVGMVRLDIFWFDISRGEHKFDFSKYDDLINQLDKAGIPLLGLLHYNKTFYDNGVEIWNRPPESNDEFSGYVSKTVNRYKSIIHHWEIWNEPNHDDYWKAPKDNLKRYSRLLTHSYQAAKAADPQCLVLNGGITDPVINDVKNLYQNAGKEYFDRLNIHTFLNPFSANPEQDFKNIIDPVLQIQKEYGDSNKKIWITEMGCPGIPAGKKEQAWFGGEPMNEKQQADWLKRQYALREQVPQIEMMFWAFYRDTDDIFHQATDYFGLVRADLSPKPAFEVYKNLIRNHLLLRQSTVDC